MTERRRSIRLASYDYSSLGTHFVTVCAHIRACSFESDKVKQVLEQTWREISDHFRHARTDEFVVMPNHIHGIVWILERDGVSGQPSRVRPRPYGPWQSAGPDRLPDRWGRSLARPLPRRGV